MIFLIDYDPTTGTLVRFQTFQEVDRSLAEKERLEIELEHLRNGIAREVVILEASSDEQIRISHRRYFETPEQIFEAFMEALAA